VVFCPIFVAMENIDFLDSPLITWICLFDAWKNIQIQYAPKWWWMRVMNPMLQKKTYCWWFRNPAPVEVGSLSHSFQGFLYISGGDRRICSINSIPKRTNQRLSKRIYFTHPARSESWRWILWTKMSLVKLRVSSTWLLFWLWMVLFSVHLDSPEKVAKL